MAKEKICGIYCIENLINGKKYIGQSQNVHRRISNHKNLLRKGGHHNQYLQNAWNKYGEGNFIFYLIAECSSQEIDALERKYISQYQTNQDTFGYNLESGGNYGKHHSNKTIEKLIQIHREEKIPLYCVELNRKFNGFIDVMREFNVSYCAIKRCCDNKRGTCRGYHWLYLSDVNEQNIQRCLSYVDKDKKPVYCFELDTIFESERAASKATGASHIGACCRNLYGRRSAGIHPLTKEKLHWCFVEEIDTYKIIYQKKRCPVLSRMKKVLCIETGQIFDSVHIAEQELHVHHVGDVCNHKRKSAGGLHFKFI